MTEPLTDNEFLQYIEAHSASDNPLFVEEDVKRLYALAEQTPILFRHSGYVYLDKNAAKPLLQKIRIIQERAERRQLEKGDLSSDKYVYTLKSGVVVSWFECESGLIHASSVLNGEKQDRVRAACGRRVVIWRPARYLSGIMNCMGCEGVVIRRLR